MAARAGGEAGAGAPVKARGFIIVILKNRLVARENIS
jgi:hypothetical protein